MKRNHFHFLSQCHLTSPNFRLEVSHLWSLDEEPRLQLIKESSLPLTMVIDSRIDLRLNQSWWDRGRIYLGFLNFHCLATGHEWERMYICFLHSHLWAWWPQTRANLKKTGPRSKNSNCLLRGLFPRLPKVANPWAATGILITCFPQYTGAISAQRCEMVFSQYSVSLFYLGVESTLLCFSAFPNLLKHNNSSCFSWKLPLI